MSGTITAKLTAFQSLFQAWIIFFALPFSAVSQEPQPINLGIPPIWNYPKKIYKAGTQNWDAAQDSRGMLYWANNEGLLRYNGNQWTCFPVANRTIVRSVAIDSGDKIYVGAQSDLGFFVPGATGVLEYHSLLNLMPEEHRTFEDVWDIVFYEGDVFFRTNKCLFRLHGDGIITLIPGGPLHSLLRTHDQLMVQGSGDTLFVYDGISFSSIRRVPGLASPITGAMEWKGDTTLITTLKQGIYYITPQASGRWQTPHDETLAEKRIYSSTLLPGHYLALGTSLEGLIVMDQHRRVYRHLTRRDGLQNNNILHTFSDRAGNVWLGLDNGIDGIILDSKFTNLRPDGELQGTGYAATVSDNYLYLGVSNGTYIAPWLSYYNPESQPYFRRIDHTDGQVWNLQCLDQRVWMGHHEGAFHLDTDQATLISPDPGAWTFVQLDDDHIMAGSYAGLGLYKKVSGSWTYAGRMHGLDESCRIMVRDFDGAIWVSHPYRGLYRVLWNRNDPLHPEVRFYGQTDGLPSNLNNYVFRISGKAVFGTEQGVYAFQSAHNRFLPDPDFNALLGQEHRVKYLREDPEGHIWYATNDEVGVLQIEDNGVRKHITKQIFPELTGKLVGGFEFVFPVDRSNVLFGTEEGFILYTRHPPYSTDSILDVMLSGIQLRGKRDSLIYGGYAAADGLSGISPTLDAGMNNLVFFYTATEYKTPGLVEYSTRLLGQEDAWSAWTGETQRTFTNLGPGRYTFEIQARVKGGRISEIASYAFRIRPPWYKTTTAFAFYTLGFLGLFGGVVMRQRHRFESEKAQMTETHQQKEAEHIREVEESKAALTEIQNEKLEVEIKYKNQELALTTMHLVQKAEILLTVQASLNQIKEKSKTPEVKKDIQHLINLLNFDINLDEDWAHFAYHFDQVHVDFLNNLREQFPQLSSNDYKLCAYLRMNLSTKEIAPLMNISIRGVEGSRYRLRRKLGLGNDVNLTDFILSLPPSLPVQKESKENESPAPPAPQDVPGT